MDFIEDDQVEDVAQRLQRDGVQALRRVDIPGVQPRAGLVRDEFLEALVFSLLHQGVAVGYEQYAPRLFVRRNTSIRPIVVRVLPEPVAITISALRLPPMKASPTRRIASCW